MWIAFCFVSSYNGSGRSVQVTLLGYSLDTFPQGFAKGDLDNALDGLQWGAE